MRWFDAHLDLAYLAVNGRSMAAPLDRSAGPHAPASVTLHELRDAGVEAFLGTIFTEADGKDAVGYPAADARAAYARGVAQLDCYRQWADRGELMIQKKDSPKPATVPGKSAKAWERAPIVLAEPMRVLILMECADPIREPAELEWWAEKGVRAIGLAWARGSRYASGNSEPSCKSLFGLNEAGVELVREMDRLGVVHDVSHLSDRAFGELMARAGGRVMASHSNARALLGDPSNQRHLTDLQIREIVQRGGMIGLNLYGKFLVPRGQARRATIADAVAHVDHVCTLVGDTSHVGLGSDLDGGFSANELPKEIERVSHFVRLAEGLHDAGWSDEAIHAFAWGNWARWWGLA